MNAVLETYQQYVDSIINRELQSVLGNTDTNGYQILLPLSGTFDIIDIQKQMVQLQTDTQIEMAADNYVIALFFQDKSENYEKPEKAKEFLLDTIHSKLGPAISTEIDLTTEFLLQNYYTWQDGTPIALEDGSGLFLISNVPKNATFGDNPDSRVIFVPRSSL